MRIRPINAIALAACGLAPCLTAKGGKLDDGLRRVMPASEYSLIVGSKYRRFFTESPIDGYVKFVGAVSGNNVVVRDVVSAEPGSIDTKTAKALAHRANLSGTATGSRVSSSVDVYVIFYNQNKTDRVALVFAVPGDGFGHVQQTSREYFIEIVEYHVGSKTNDSNKATPSATPKGAGAGS
jgi:hypothetical protein